MPATSFTSISCDDWSRAATLLPTTSADYDDAAQLYRTCRRNGATVRRMIDCLIAAVAIRAVVPILHADADFDVLRRHTRLTTHRASTPS